METATNQADKPSVEGLSELVFAFGRAQVACNGKGSDEGAEAYKAVIQYARRLASQSAAEELPPRAFHVADPQRHREIAAEELPPIAPVAQIEREALSERLKLQAQSHAQEARTANDTIAEIYQLVTGATGEPGNWHGAEPVRQALARIRAEALEEAAKVCDREESACRERTVYAGALIASHIGSAIRALVQPSTGQKT